MCQRLNTGESYNFYFVVYIMLWTVKIPFFGFFLCSFLFFLCFIFVLPFLRVPFLLLLCFMLSLEKSVIFFLVIL